MHTVPFQYGLSTGHVEHVDVPAVLHEVHVPVEHQFPVIQFVFERQYIQFVPFQYGLSIGHVEHVDVLVVSHVVHVPDTQLFPVMQFVSVIQFLHSDALLQYGVFDGQDGHVADPVVLHEEHAPLIH